MMITKKNFIVLGLFWSIFCQARAENKIDPIRYMYGTWRCNHYAYWANGGNLNEEQIAEIVSSKLHIEKGRIYFKGTKFGGKQLFKPSEVTVRQLFDSDDDSYTYTRFSLEKHPLRFMFNECRLGELDVIFLPIIDSIKAFDDDVYLGELYLYRETLILNYIDRTTLFMEKSPHVRQTYKGTKSSTITFLIPDNTSFILLSYEIEDVAADLAVNVDGTVSTKKKIKPNKNTLFSTSTAATCGTKTVRLYVSPEHTRLTVSIRTDEGEGKWRIRMEAY